MLRITIKGNKDQICWRRGAALVYIYNLDNVEKIEADGDELDLLKYLFGFTIPFTNLPSTTWYGDIARTILANLFTLR